MDWEMGVWRMEYGLQMFEARECEQNDTCCPFFHLYGGLFFFSSCFPFEQRLI